MTDLDRFLAALRQFLAHRLARGGRYGLAFTLAVMGVVAAMVLFVAIIGAVTDRSALYAFDMAVVQRMADVTTDAGTRWMVFFSWIGGRNTVWWVVALGLVLLALRRWWSLVGLVFATAVGGLLSVILKLVFARARPLEAIVPAAGYSFPSGHAFAAMVFYGYALYLVWKHVRGRTLRLLLGALCVALILTIGFSRIYLRVHYVTDVAGGFLAGAAWLVACLLALEAVEGRRALRRDDRT